MEKVDLLFYICVRVLMWEDFSQVWRLQTVCLYFTTYRYVKLKMNQYTTEILYNTNTILYQKNYSVKAEKITYFTANKPILKNRSSMHAFVTVEIKLKIESQWS